MRATEQDGSYPRPMLRRDRWTSLDGAWGFAVDDADEGLAERWYDGSADPFSSTIQVPYPPESPASGIEQAGFHPVVWYRRTVSHDALVGADEAGEDGTGADTGTGARTRQRRVLVHFGAVDHAARVWLDGHLVAHHVGGQSPFTADVTDVLDPGAEEHVLVVRAQDDPHDLDQPRGKQDWRERPHGIWYERTTGIWQTVWSETVPAAHVADIAWSSDISTASVRAEVTVASVPPGTHVLELALRLGDDVIARLSCTVTEKVTRVDVPVPALRNGQDRARLVWTPESPQLLDATVVLRDLDPGRTVDVVESYLGIRTLSVGGGWFALNGQPYYLRSVLNQGYREQTHLASHGSDQLRAEVELIKAMGFNSVRVHQKAEDPRFLYWADRLGLMVWAETAGAYAFSSRAVELLTAEWLELVRRDRSHPSIVAWVPVNESWGVQDIGSVVAQQAYTRALANLTRALDPGRPVLSNEGWEHVDSDILGLHDYTVDPEHLRARYADQQSATAVALAVHGPQGRRPILGEPQKQAFLAGDSPLMITEFGGISVSEDEDSWGYGQATSLPAYADLLMGLFDALRASPQVVGFCYTQFMDTGQETNGLVYADGAPKLPLDTMVHIVTGAKGLDQEMPTSTFGWTE
ncbi:MAG TPA: glycoside hydrolase family 2 TIM barrel-domain containing protein [Nocardioidaceae bacterium]|nr:glycoside hydrolase family 2 TIM barrel-domain containing protein [Nocardioidaceae bacterium]